MKLDALPDVEADAAGPVLVGVVDEAAEVLAAATPGPGLLDRLAVLQDVAEPAQRHAVRPHQPLVGGTHHRVRTHLVERKVERADRLRAVDHHPRADLPRPRREPRQVESRAVGPVHVPDRQHRRALVDRVVQRVVPGRRRGPRARLARPRSAPRRRAAPARRRHGWTLLGNCSPATTMCWPGRSGRLRATIAMPYDTLGSTATCSRRGVPSTSAKRAFTCLDVGEEILGPDRPGPLLAGHAGSPRLLHRVRQRRHVGAIQVVDVGIDRGRTSDRPSAATACRAAVRPGISQSRPRRQASGINVTTVSTCAVSGNRSKTVSASTRRPAAVRTCRSRASVAGSHDT